MVFRLPAIVRLFSKGSLGLSSYPAAPLLERRALGRRSLGIIYLTIEGSHYAELSLRSMMLLSLGSRPGSTRTEEYPPPPVDSDIVEDQLAWREHTLHFFRKIGNPSFYKRKLPRRDGTYQAFVYSICLANSTQSDLDRELSSSKCRFLKSA